MLPSTGVVPKCVGSSTPISGHPWFRYIYLTTNLCISASYHVYIQKNLPPRASKSFGSSDTNIVNGKTRFPKLRVRIAAAYFSRTRHTPCPCTLRLCHFDMALFSGECQDCYSGGKKINQVIFEVKFKGFFFFFFEWLHLQQMEVLGLGVKWELQLPAYTTALATWDPSHISDLLRRLWQRWILQTLSEARDQIGILKDAMSGS